MIKIKVYRKISSNFISGHYFAGQIGELCIAEIDICPSNASCIDAKCKCNRLYKEKEGACIKMGKYITRNI